MVRPVDRKRAGRQGFKSELQVHFYARMTNKIGPIKRFSLTCSVRGIRDHREDVL